MNVARYFSCLAVLVACEPKPTATTSPSEPTASPSSNSARPAEATSSAPPAGGTASTPVSVERSPATECTTDACIIAEMGAKMREFADAMCACKGKGQPCAEVVTTSMIRYAESVERRFAGRPEPKVDGDAQNAISEAIERLSACTIEVSKPPQ